MPNLRFLKTMLKDYNVGALTRSSRFVVRKISSLLPAGTKTIIEYGPGDGVITQQLLTQLPSDGKLVGFEFNADFVQLLKRELNDPRCTIAQGDVEQLSKNVSQFGIARADAIISGIPFSFFSVEKRKTIVAQTHASLRDGGRFIVYQYSPLMVKYLKQAFSKVSVKFEPRNFPPYFIMVAEK